jgi:hypothetical protein
MNELYNMDTQVPITIRYISYRRWEADVWDIEVLYQETITSNFDQFAFGVLRHLLEEKSYID